MRRLLIAALVAACACAGGAAQAAQASFTWSAPQLTDTAYPFANTGTFNGVSCAPGICLTSGQVSYGADQNPETYLFSAAASPGGSWQQVPMARPAADFATPACFSAALCVVPLAGRLSISTTPARGPFTMLNEPPGMESCTPDCAAPDLSAADCPSEAMCVVGTHSPGFLAVLGEPTNPRPGGWSTPLEVDPSHGIAAIACPSPGFCVAVDDAGSAFTSTTPATGPWTEAAAAPGAKLISLACPAPNLCIAGDARGDVFATTDPASGGWTKTVLTASPGHHGTSVSCRAANLCVAVVGASRYVSGTAATGGWRSAIIDPGHSLLGVSCAAGGSCTAVDDRGFTIAAADPSTTSWTGQPVLGSNAIASIACIPHGLCLADDQTGHVLQIHLSATGIATTARAVEPGDVLADLSCAGQTLCAAITASGRVLATTAPAGSGPWSATKVDEPARLDALSCPTARRCYAIDDHGYVFTSADPGARRPVWQRFRVTKAALGLLACPTARLCVAIDGGGHEWVSADAAAGRRQWRRRTMSRDPNYQGSFALACASAHSCLALTFVVNGGDFGDLGTLVTSRPATGPWRARTAASEYFGEGNNAPMGAVLTCPSSGECVAATAAGDMFWTFAPLSRHPWASFQTLDDEGTSGAGVPLDAVACASLTVCIAGDAAGNLIVGRR